MSKFIISQTAHKRLGNLPQSKETTLKSGANGNKQTVSIMQNIARQRSKHQLIRRLAENILLDAKIPSHHYLDECMAIGEFVRRHVRYVKDPQGMEQLSDPVLMVKMIQEGRAVGDCDDISLLIATLLLSVGHHCFFRIVKYKKFFGPYNHIYVVTYQNNLGTKKERLVLDGIVKHKPLGFEVPHKTGKEIPL
jgi:hypothetical protein